MNHARCGPDRRTWRGLHRVAEVVGAGGVVVAADGDVGDGVGVADGVPETGGAVIFGIAALNGMAGFSRQAAR